MKRKTKLKLFSFLLVPLTLSTLSLPTIINNINNLKLLNENNKISQPTTQTLSQEYWTNSFTFDSSSKVGSQFLLNKDSTNQIQNPLFPFAKSYQVNDGIWIENGYMNNTIEIDLNTWKPIGMSDEIFLKSLQFDVDGYINFDTTYDTDNNTTLNQSQRIIDYNISKDSFAKGFEYDENNFQNLYVKENTKTTKLVSNLLNSKDAINKGLQYGNTDYGFCFLTFEIEHQKAKKDPNINRLLITPKIEYAWGIETQDYQTTIPSQKINFTFKSNLFNYDIENQISIDFYVSDNFALDASNGQNSTSAQLDTSNGNNSIIFSSKKDNNPDLGQAIPLAMKEINIDTSNFYLDESNNHQDDNFKVSIEGINLSSAILSAIEKDGSSESSKPITKVVNFINQSKDIKIEFNINDNEFNSKNQVTKTITIFDNSMLSKTDQDTFGRKETGLNLILTIEKKADFK